MRRVYHRRPPLERFWEKVKKSDDGCWIWTGTMNTGGYGKFSVQYLQVVAHRWIYEQLIGPIPTGLQLDHLCHNRAVALGMCEGGASCLHRRCVNPEHLEPVTQRENLIRGIRSTNGNEKKTHCLRGHEFTPENTRVSYRRSVNGERSCLTCARQWVAFYRARDKQKATQAL